MDEELNYERWLREGDTTELVHTVGRYSNERAPVKRNGRIRSANCRSGQYSGCGGADGDEKSSKKSHDHQSESFERELERCH